MGRGLTQGMLALLVLAWSCPLLALDRDPTLAPAGAFALPAAVASTAVADPDNPAMPEVSSAAVLVRAGKPYLVSGSRLYPVGQAIGPFKIERISETEVWLRNGKELHKIQRFSGIERQPATERPTP